MSKFKFSDDDGPETTREQRDLQIDSMLRKMRDPQYRLDVDAASNVLLQTEITRYQAMSIAGYPPKLMREQLAKIKRLSED